MKRLFILLVVLGLSPLGVLDAKPEESLGLPNGDGVIRGMAGGSEIVVRTSARTAGAICSVVWRGKEFIDATDHGRELQSASNFDVDGEIKGETFNPTEGGSRDDSAGPSSTSRLLYLHAAGAELVTTNQMAFWLLPGEKSEGNLAKNTTALSNHLLSKRVRIGVTNFPHALEYRVTFTLPKDERHVHGVFEALTGYMPIEFDDFWVFDLGSRKLISVSKDLREDVLPLVFSTKDGAYAMGIYSPPDAKLPKRTYGRFRFDWAKVTKWNCVFRINDAKGIAPGDYSCRMFVMVGTLEDVRGTMDGLCRAEGA
ncbi:MAG TPA: hypothetical protein VH413_05815 [Verrucomicrobiae bacterium]|jgi:hypothetical protein|nr:hypothetical protein [Verrucomicrobiae bacterium]